MFVHWPVEWQQIRLIVPRPIEIETYKGQAWLTIVAFYMQAFSFNSIRPVAIIKDFPEVNLRTYVKYHNQPGIWFISLDVPSRFAVYAANLFFNLPYRLANIYFKEFNGVIDCRHNCQNKNFNASYKPIKSIIQNLDPFEKWATERYIFYCMSKSKKIYRGRITHNKWCLRQAQLNIKENSLIRDWEIG